MSYKSIDLQASLPRAMEMSPLQQQQQQRSATEQSMLGQQAVKAAEHEAHRSGKTESATNDTISDRQPRERDRRQLSKSKNNPGDEEAEGPKAAEHPYKGKHIDFMG
ncbi:hypothetical protein ACFPPD_25510 [Cohnella suwonensis]|uniref:RNA polymerase sigma factor n=1 Tax=Cohnella suwonensis TaxID=696072 RepID=A0ABW0M517_9BACL